jgi:hypothetical protein
MFARAISVTSLKYVSANDEDTYENFAYSVSGRTGLVFGVNACKDVHLALSEIPGITTRYTYELVIGTSDNSFTVLRDAVNGQMLTQSNTAEILHCTMTRMFWISWAADAISFGSGTVLEQSRLLYFKDSNSHPVNAVSVMTPLGVLGNFTFEHYSGKSPQVI